MKMIARYPGMEISVDQGIINNAGLINCYAAAGLRILIR